MASRRSVSLEQWFRPGPGISTGFNGILRAVKTRWSLKTGARDGHIFARRERCPGVAAVVDRRRASGFGSFETRTDRDQARCCENQRYSCRDPSCPWTAGSEDLAGTAGPVLEEPFRDP